jgi:hypothetical protein
MHKLILLLALFLSSLPNLQAQNQENRLLIEEYLQQSEKQKKAGITIMAVGAATAGLGLLLAATSNDWGNASFGGGIILFVGGSAAVIIGVPIIISSASKARKAAQLSIGTNSARVIHQHGTYSTFYPALNISFPINSTRR